MKKKRRTSSRSSHRHISDHTKREIDRFWQKYGMMILAVIAALAIGTVLLKVISK